MRTLTTFLAVALVLVTINDIQTHKRNRSNDEAATECAVRTGFLYNCTDGTQSASCKGDN
jgi:hypothetical protein